MHTQIHTSIKSGALKENGALNKLTNSVGNTMANVHALQNLTSEKTMLRFRVDRLLYTNRDIICIVASNSLDEQ